jgi:peptidoglycan hydrolase FlgJ
VTTIPTTPNAAAGTSAAAPATQAAPDQAKLKKAAQAFEAVFVRQLIGTMRSASGGDDNDGLFDSEATKQFQDMADSKTADAMSQKGALHIADMLVKQYGARMANTVAPASGTAPANGLSLVPGAGAAPTNNPALVSATTSAPLALVAATKTETGK